jgi:Fe-S-cluster-containing dehydrogenase component
VANFAWVIDQTSCIGCHACTTACKSENEVPLGVNRTWVKYVERGTFPETRRDIAVLRCNHCADAPCVKVCPTTAMFKRADGIVDFDTSRCIGCKACIQACPYDAIYIDPEEHVAEKCNFCAHRVDVGLLPACVVVCPTESLIFGDIEDPASRAAQVIASRPTTVRRPGSTAAGLLRRASPAPRPGARPHATWADRRTGAQTPRRWRRWINGRAVGPRSPHSFVSKAGKPASPARPLISRHCYARHSQPTT